MVRKERCAIHFMLPSITTATSLLLRNAARVIFYNSTMIRIVSTRTHKEKQTKYHPPKSSGPEGNIEY